MYDPQLRHSKRIRSVDWTSIDYWEIFKYGPNFLPYFKKGRKF